MLISGRCHCGNIFFALDWRPEPSEIRARACTCSFCAKHGGVWTSCPTGSLTVNVVNAFENVEPALLRRAPATFEGESEQARLSRRKRNWIADVRFEATS
jgi:hypothetical protein